MNWQITMAPDAWDLMWAYTDLITGEVACFGYTELRENTKEVYISEVFLVPQQASAAEVDFMTAGLPFAIEKALTEGRIDDLRFCIHSHGDFGANWSPTDEDMIRKIGSTGTPWFASVIFNKKGASTGRIDIFGDAGPFGRTQHVLKDLDVTLERTFEYEEARIAELERFVAKPPKKTAVKQLTAVSKSGVPKAQETKPSDFEIKMVEDDVIQVTRDGKETVINLAELDAWSIERLSEALDLDWTDDSTGTRYYWHADHDVFFSVKAEAWAAAMSGDRAHEYTDAAI